MFRLRRSRLKVTGTTVGQLASESVAIGSTVVDEYLWLCSELVSCAQVQKESVSQACPHLGRQDRAEQVPPRVADHHSAENRPFVVDEVKLTVAGSVDARTVNLQLRS